MEVGQLGPRPGPDRRPARPGRRSQVGQGARKVADDAAGAAPFQAQLGLVLRVGPGEVCEGEGVVEHEGGCGPGLLVAQAAGGPLAGGDGAGGQLPVVAGRGPHLAGQPDRLDQVGGDDLGQAEFVAGGSGEPVGQAAVELGAAGLGQDAVGDVPEQGVVEGEATGQPLDQARPDQPLHVVVGRRLARLGHGRHRVQREPEGCANSYEPRELPVCIGLGSVA